MTSDARPDPRPGKGRTDPAPSDMEPRDPNTRYIIDPVAFFVSLIGGPVLFTLATFWIGIPVAALVLGGPVYLITGTPVLLIYLARNPPASGGLAGLAFCTVVVLATTAFAVAALSGASYAAWAILFFAGFGAIFAPLWALSFGWLYRRLARDFFTRPIPLS